MFNISYYLIFKIDFITLIFFIIIFKNIFLENFYIKYGKFFTNIQIYKNKIKFFVLI